MRLIPILAAAMLAGCSLFGPPLPPATPRADVAEFEVQPARARDAFVACARRYGEGHGQAPGVSAESIADAALHACSAELEAYRAIAHQRAQGEARVLGWFDRSGALTQEAVEAAKADARLAAMDAIIRARSGR
jgi:hypothetical protein